MIVVNHSIKNLRFPLLHIDQYNFYDTPTFVLILLNPQRNYE